ncbi:MAG: hypothetical protein AUG51_11435 [Acidobacteria bacterium 13_1_20CM_3_53_8]|nr:MAG: hypothetical protein AUG51_11435 [Acidobacteria bacterium 13_1_20CM_3_53_8]
MRCTAIPYASSTRLPRVTRKAAFCSSLFIAALLCFTPCKAQQQASEPNGQHQSAEPAQVDDVLRIDTDLVPVDVTVTDAEGQPVRNLRAEDFRLYEDGAERQVSFFNVERRGGDLRPIAVVFALDVSGSMSIGEMTRLRTAMQSFSQTLAGHPASFAVMTFGMKVKTLQSFTSDLQKLERAFDRLEREPEGLSTHTYDAVDDAIRMLTRSAPRTLGHRLMKRAVVVVTDGFPVGDVVAPQTVIERANAAGVSVYTVTLPSYSRMIASTARTPLPTPLDVSGLTERTGGTSVYATEQDFGPLFRALAEEVTSAYVLAFYPPESNRHDGRFHSIRITVPPGLTIKQSRPGYQGSR